MAENVGVGLVLVGKAARARLELDVFLSHASEDKDDVRAFARRLRLPRADWRAAP